jgi:hypothetical protein
MNQALADESSPCRIEYFLRYCLWWIHHPPTMKINLTIFYVILLSTEEKGNE